MSTPNLNGYRDEPESDKHWTFEDDLEPRMGAASGSGDMDLRPFTSPRHDQRSTSSCVGNAVAKALEIKRIMKHGHDAHVDLSRLAIYYLARELMFPPETHMDGGTYISHAFDVLRRFGVPPEEDWPWDTDKVTTPPSWRAMRKAYLHKIDSFYRIRSSGQDRVDAVVKCLQAGNPVVFGTNVDGTWFGYGKSDVLQPVLDRDRSGRHATVLIGFKDGKFIGENSWGCYDDQTEVLTSVGWKPWPSVKGDEEFATLNPQDHTLEYQQASAHHIYPFDGELHRFVSQGVDLLVTPNHRMYVTNHHKRHRPNWPIIRADAIDGSRRVCFKKDAENPVSDVDKIRVAGMEVPSDLWLEFLGYFLSEGSTTSRSGIRTRERTRSYMTKGGVLRCGTTGQFIENMDPVMEERSCSYTESYIENYYVTALSQAVGEDADKIAACTTRLPFTFAEHVQPASGNRQARRVWTCQGKPLFEALQVFGKAPEKYIPREFLRLSRRQSRILLDGLMLGDGTSEGSWVYYTSSRQLADDVQELALRSGYAADISITDRTNQPGYNEPEYVVGIKRTRIRPEARYMPIRVPYQGKVYCVTVPNGLLYVRRNGQAVWCGNSDWGDDGFYWMDPAVVAHSVSSNFWTALAGWEDFL